MASSVRSTWDPVPPRPRAWPSAFLCQPFPDCGSSRWNLPGSSWQGGSQCTRQAHTTAVGCTSLTCSPPCTSAPACRARLRMGTVWPCALAHQAGNPCTSQEGEAEAQAPERSIFLQCRERGQPQGLSSRMGQRDDKNVKAFHLEGGVLATFSGSGIQTTSDYGDLRGFSRK